MKYLRLRYIVTYALLPDLQAVNQFWNQGYEIVYGLQSIDILIPLSCDQMYVSKQVAFGWHDASVW